MPCSTKKPAPPGPCPIAVEGDISIHGTPLYAIQVQADVVMMLATPVPPEPEKLKGVPAAVAVHVDPVCVTDIDVPAIVRVVLRCEKLFGSAKMLIVAEPVPLGLEITPTHGTGDTAVQVHCEGKVSVKVVRPPLESNVIGDGVIPGSLHDPAL